MTSSAKSDVMKPSLWKRQSRMNLKRSHESFNGNTGTDFFHLKPENENPKNFRGFFGFGIGAEHFFFGTHLSPLILGLIEQQNEI